MCGPGPRPRPDFPMGLAHRLGLYKDLAGPMVSRLGIPLRGPFQRPIGIIEFRGVQVKFNENISKIEVLGAGSSLDR